MFKLEKAVSLDAKPQNPITVVFFVAITSDEVLLLDKFGEDCDLLCSKYPIDDCGLIVPPETGSGVYKCTNLQVTNLSYSNNPENPEPYYDLECDWERILDFAQYMETNRG